MNREILFKAIAEDKSGFYYGDLYHKDHELQIIPKGECAKYVLQDTIGQYTGLKDKNGVMIFEGDKIKHPHAIFKDSYFIVKYDKNKASFVFESTRYNDKTVSEIELITQFEVIGNIYDKELK